MRWFLIAALCCLPALAADKAEEIIARHIAARGGDNWQSVKTMKLTGSYMAFSKPNPFTLTKAWPDKMRFEHTLIEDVTTIGSDGEALWWIHPGMGIAEPAYIQGLDRIVQSQDADLFTPFFTYRDHGYQVSYEGIGEIEGVEGHQLKLVRGENHVETWIIDPETFLEAARQSPGSDYGRPFEQLTFFDDFREVDGVMVPHTVETLWHTRRRLMEVKAVEIGVAVGDDVFVKPLPSPIEPLAGMRGSFDVAAGFNGQGSGEFPTSPQTAEIELAYNDNLFIEKTVAIAFRGPMEVMRTLAFDTNRDHYVMTMYNTLTSHTNILTGKLEDGALTLTNVDTGTSWGFRPGQVIHDKIVIHDVSTGGFVLDAYYSPDGGENWTHYQQNTYTRK